jgi:hypothetical protein
MQSIYERININELADIQDVVIDADLSKEEKLKSYYRQIKNPFCYRFDDMIIRVSFTDNGATFADRIKQYLLSGQGMDLVRQRASWTGDEKQDSLLAD